MYAFLFFDGDRVLLPASMAFVRFFLCLPSLLSIDTEYSLCVLVIDPSLLSGSHDVEFVLDNEIYELLPLLIIDELVLAARVAFACACLAVRHANSVRNLFHMVYYLITSK